MVITNVLLILFNRLNIYIYKYISDGFTNIFYLGKFFEKV